MQICQPVQQKSQHADGGLGQQNQRAEAEEAATNADEERHKKKAHRKGAADH